MRQYGGDQVAADNKKYVDADKSPGEQTDPGMKQNNRQDGDWPKAINLASILHRWLPPNVGSGDKILFRDVIDIAKDKLGSTSKYIAIEPPKFHRLIQIKDFYMNTTKLKSLDFVQNISVEEGIRALCCK